MPITTVDVWDTLLRRKCHPDEIKLGVAGYVTVKYHALLTPFFRDREELHKRRYASEVEIGRIRVGEGLDDEYELTEVWYRTIRASAPGLDPVEIDSIVSDICEYEYLLELDSTYPDPTISAVLERFAGTDDKWFLSDFYMANARLASLIKVHHPQLDLKGGLVSCEVGLNKRSGRLFEAFEERQRPVEITRHIGDNSVSDVAIPQARGIQSYHFVNSKEEQRKEQLLHQFLRRQAGDLYSIWQEIKEVGLRSAKRKRAGRKGAAFDLGVEFAPTMVAYTLFAIEEAMRRQVDTVYYFTREGELLAQIHAAISEALPQVKMPKPQVLEVSRVATFGASLRKVDSTELARLWTMYPTHSMRALLLSLGEQPESLSIHLKAHGIEMDEVISHPWNDSRFQRLLANRAFQADIQAGLDQRRRDLLGYLAERGINADTKNVCIVDIGWRGTIQDNLARVLPDTHWHGVYLALFRFLNTQPENTSKSAYLFDCNNGVDTEEDITPQAPAEMLFNSASGSVTGYSCQNGRYIAHRLANEEENKVHRSFTEFFQEGVLSATPAISSYMRVRGLLSADVSLFARRTIKELLARPPRAMARAYFQLSHNETFGNGRFVMQDGALRLVKALRKVRPSSVVRELDDQAGSSGWVDGFFSANNLATARAAYRLISNVRGIFAFVRSFSIKSYKYGYRRVFNDLQMALNAPRDVVQKAKPIGREIQPLLRVVGDVDFTNTDALNFNYRHSNLRKQDDGPLRMSWIIPDIGVGSGGHMTILRFVRYFRELGFQCSIYVHERSEHGSSEALKVFIETYYMQLDGIDVYSSVDHVEDCDILIATLWVTAYDIFKRTNCKLKCYFIQDFEPDFYPRGSHAVLAANSYKLNLFGISASSWLEKIVSNEYGMDGCKFNLGYDPHSYFEDQTVIRDRDKVSVYMRPSTERRGTELLIAALSLVKKQRPKTKVVIFGTDNLGYSDIPFRAEVVGLQNEEQLRRLHSSSAVTLLSSLTNYSLLPIEAAACGAVVVDLDVDSMQATFGHGSPVVLAPPDPVGLARRLITLLDSPEDLSRRSAESMAFAQQFTWEAAFATVTNGLARGYFGDAPCSRRIPSRSLIRAYNGQRIYYVENGARYHIASAEEFLKAGFSFAAVTQISLAELLSLPDNGLYSELNASYEKGSSQMAQ